MSFLKIYFLLNLGLATSYLAFLVLRSSKLKAPPALLARAGLIFLAMGLLAPLGLTITQSRHLARIPIAFREPMAEGGRPQRSRVKPVATRPIPPVPPSSESGWKLPTIPQKSLIHLALFVIFGGIFFSLIRAARDLRDLQR